MRDHLDRLGDATVAVVTFAPPERAAALRRHLDVPFAFVSDVDRALYRALGAERGSLRQVWSAGTLREYGRLLREGRRLTRPTEDTRQLGADVVVDAGGTIRFLALPRSPDERPPLDALVAAVDAAR